MDWRFNTIWFDKIENNLLFSKDYKKNQLLSNNDNPFNSEYFIFWYMKEKNLNDLIYYKNIKYLELNSSSLKNFETFQNIQTIKRLDLHYCTKLLTDFGISKLKNSLQILHVNQSKKFTFKTELIELKNLKVLSLNNCGEIENLDFLENLPDLIDFRFVNTNIKSGDLNPIIKHKKIKSVGFLNKRHYSHKTEEIEKILNEKKTDLKIINEFKDDFFTFRYDF